MPSMIRYILSLIPQPSLIMYHSPSSRVPCCLGSTEQTSGINLVPHTEWSVVSGPIIEQVVAFISSPYEYIGIAFSILEVDS